MASDGDDVPGRVEELERAIEELRLLFQERIAAIEEELARSGW